MLNTLNELVKDKSVLILGFGKEGKSTFFELNKLNTYKCLDIADKLDINQDINSKHKLITGTNYLDCIDEYDIVFKSPGIVLPKDISEYKCTITSQTEVFIDSYSSQIIGITGTKGKSTTSSLLYHILKSNSKDTILAGNIGIPVFDIYNQITSNTIVVLELSCHQLQYSKVSPKFSVLLNLYEDHLDYYKTFERYVNAKLNIYRNQNENDILFCTKDFAPNDALSKVVLVDTSSLPINTIENTQLKGEHNLLNIAFVYNIIKLFDINDDDFVSSLNSYKPLSHRLEYIGTKNDIDYYDDSISTTCESTISAIKSIKNIDTVLIGGLDRGINYSILVEFLLESKVTNIILMYESGANMFNMLKAYPSSSKNIILVNDLYEALDVSTKCTCKNGACVLSPASASYGDFKNFEERGIIFKKIIFEGETNE